MTKFWSFKIKAEQRSFNKWLKEFVNRFETEPVHIYEEGELPPSKTISAPTKTGPDGIGLIYEEIKLDPDPNEKYKLINSIPTKLTFKETVYIDLEGIKRFRFKIFFEEEEIVEIETIQYSFLEMSYAVKMHTKPQKKELDNGFEFKSYPDFSTEFFNELQDWEIIKTSVNLNSVFLRTFLLTQSMELDPIPSDEQIYNYFEDKKTVMEILIEEERTLKSLEKKVAGFGSLHLPTHFEIELEDQQNKVNRLKEELKTLKKRIE